MKIYTIRDVAQLAGVSVTTVSRVLNHRPDVNAATREKVERVMVECNFVGNANARSLKQLDGDVAALILRGRSNPFLSGLAETMLQFARESDVSFLMESIDEKDDEFQTALRLMHEKRARGFIFIGSRLDARLEVLRGQDVPMVFATVNAVNAGLPRAASVSIDDRRMGREAMEMLIRAGHTKIAIFGGSRNQGDGLADRYIGAREACEQAGVPFDETRYVETRFSLEDAYNAARNFFATRSDTTAVFAMSDMVAMGVIRALRGHQSTRAGGRERGGLRRRGNGQVFYSQPVHHRAAAGGNCPAKRRRAAGHDGKGRLRTAPDRDGNAPAAGIHRISKAVKRLNR